MTRKSPLERAAPLLLLVATIAVWQLVCSGFGVSEFIFPSPARIAEQTWEHRGAILGHAWRTFWVTMVGFGIAIVVGVLLGFLMGSSRLAYDAMYPLMTGFNALPKAGQPATLLEGFDAGMPYLVSGGLDPNNVGMALRISGAPGVDVSTGVETAPGRKDPALIRAFIAAARRVGVRQPEGTPS